MSQDTIDRVRKCVAEVLALDLVDIQEHSTLMEDLGAESLDLVELMYTLEQEFGVRMSQKDMSLSAQLGLPDSEIHQNEVLTPKTLELLRERHPGKASIFKQGMMRKHLAALLTVGEVARGVDRKLAEPKPILAP